MKPFPHPLPQLISSELVYNGSFVKVRKDLMQRPDGATYTFDTVLLRETSVMVLALDKQGRFILNREYRHATGKVLLGCPGGLVDEGERPEAAAARELLEETGYSASHFTRLGQAYPMPGISQQLTHYLLGHDASLISTPSLDLAETIEPTPLSYLEILQAIKKGAILDGLLGTALFLYSLRQS